MATAVLINGFHNQGEKMAKYVPFLPYLIQNFMYRYSRAFSASESREKFRNEKILTWFSKWKYNGTPVRKILRAEKVELYSNSCSQNFISNDNLQETSAWVHQVFLIFFLVGLLPMVLHRNRGGLWVCSIPYFWVESMEEYVCINLLLFFLLVGREYSPAGSAIGEPTRPGMFGFES